MNNWSAKYPIEKVYLHIDRENYMAGETAWLKPIYKSKEDNSITLNWRPAILINCVDPKIPFTFYNNDCTKKFRLVKEGV